MRIFNAFRSYGMTSDPAEDWREQAACRVYDPETWFPIGTGPAAKAKESCAVAICRRCKVLADCRRWAAKVQPAYGIWAGITERRRWCQWCQNPFELEAEHPHSRICPTCAQNERFGDILRARKHGPGKTQAAKTHCPHGHGYDESNTYVDRNGHRHCRKCRNEMQVRYKANKARSTA